MLNLDTLKIAVVAWYWNSFSIVQSDVGLLSQKIGEISLGQGMAQLNLGLSSEMQIIFFQLQSLCINAYNIGEIHCQLYCPDFINVFLFIARCKCYLQLISKYSTRYTVREKKLIIIKKLICGMYKPEQRED